MKNVWLLVVAVLLMLSGPFCSAQGFQNLDFEMATVSWGDSWATGDEGMPYWSVDSVIINGYPLAGAGLGIYNGQWPHGDYVPIEFPPISGAFSAFLWADYRRSASLSQTATIPSNAQHLLFDMVYLRPDSTGSLTVSVDGQSIGSDVLAYAGKTVELQFTLSGDPNVPESLPVVGLDNIRFVGVPEPASGALLGLGLLALMIVRQKGC